MENKNNHPYHTLPWLPLGTHTVQIRGFNYYFRPHIWLQLVVECRKSGNLFRAAAAYPSESYQVLTPARVISAQWLDLIIQWDEHGAAAIHSVAETPPRLVPLAQDMSSRLQRQVWTTKTQGTFASAQPPPFPSSPQPRIRHSTL